MNQKTQQDFRESWARIVVRHDGSGSRLPRKKIHYFVEELIFIRMIVRWDVEYYGNKRAIIDSDWHWHVIWYDGAT